MQYVFAFLLISCLSVGLLTYILAFALFFRGRSAPERLFLAFLTFFTVRMIVDTTIFYVLPHLAPSGAALFVLLLVGRAAILGMFFSLSLYMHLHTGVLQSRRGRAVVYAAFALIAVFFIGELFLSRLNPLPDMRMLYEFSPVDFLIFPMLAWPIAVFLAYRRRIRHVTLRRRIGNFIVMVLCALPFMLFEDVFGSITVIFEFASPNPLPLKLFPIYYLMIYGFLLSNGFKNVLLERKSVGVPREISDEFVRRFAITTRERDIIGLMIEGASNKKIGETLFISPATVRNHLHHIFEKTGVSNRVELLRLASS